MGKGRLKDALQLAGAQHKYQQILLVLLSCIWVERVYIFLSAPYIYMDPMFHCTSTGTHHVHQKQACLMINECTIIDNFTITADLELYCNFQWARLAIQSIFPIGSFIGLMVINLISDTKGRRVAILLDLSISVIGVICVLIGGNHHNVYFLILAQFLLGFGAYSMISLGYTILADFYNDHLRQIGIVVISAIAGLGVFSIGIFYLIELYWLYFIIYFQLLPLVAILAFTYFFLHESPYVLMNHNHQDQAEQVLVRIAIFNGNKSNVPEIRKIIEEEDQRDHTRKPTLHKIFKMIKQWRFLKPIIILVVITGIGNLNYFGITYSFSQEGLGFGYNSMIFGFVQMISFIFSRYTVKNVRRKQGMTMIFGGVMVICLLFKFQFIHHNPVISSVLFGVSRILSICGYCLIVCMETQAFSVYIQSTAAGLIQGFALYGAFFAPLVVQIANYIEIDPIVLIGIFVSFAIWPQWFLQQTFHTPPILDEPKSSTASLMHISTSQMIEMQRITSDGQNQIMSPLRRGHSKIQAKLSFKLQIASMKKSKKANSSLDKYLQNIIFDYFNS